MSTKQARGAGWSGATTVVHCTRTDTEHLYTLSPRDAVLAAFALDMGDANSWDWEARWGDRISRAPHGWVAGDWWAADPAQAVRS